MSQPPRSPGGTDRNAAAALALLQQLQPALQQRDRGRQVHILRELVAMGAPMGDQWQQLSQIALSHGELTLARTAIDLFVEACKGGPRARYVKAAVLEQAGDMAEAYAIMTSLPGDVPDPASNAYSLGTAALMMGQREVARGHLDRATALQPAAGNAWLSLAMAGDCATQPGIVGRIAAAGAAMDGVPAQQQAAWRYALGKARADTGDHATAFSEFAHGADIMRRLQPFNRQGSIDNARSSIDGYTASRIASIAAQQNEPTGRSIFVTGLPRSGTTLVQQIIASHSAVAGGAEISRLPILAGEIKGNSLAAVEACVAAGQGGAIARLWDHLLAERFPQPGRIVDKSLNTTRLIGLAACLLPDAPIIWMQRDPLDCAWSCFRQFFPLSVPWSYDFEDIAFQFRVEDGLRQHWQAMLGDRLLVVPYEQLVDAPEQWIGRILAHCGLPEEPACFSPHRHGGAIHTASVEQVRRPINRDGIGAAQPYKPWLQPLIRALDSAQR